ncbi:unnamed protein product [Chrysodeixis includens]|uniref:Uncharacterized protein n=1 Tax=Chrysodeixis includens TaxID=689277 RepID=A0A9N8Q0R2_CHRIL|nr:unnamed protein product [Chrysodeixis includens]
MTRTTFVPEHETSTDVSITPHATLIKPWEHAQSDNLTLLLVTTKSVYNMGLNELKSVRHTAPHPCIPAILALQCLRIAVRTRRFRVQRTCSPKRRGALEITAR